jgi:hypothetical protein
MQMHLQVRGDEFQILIDMQLKFSFIKMEMKKGKENGKSANYITMF